MVDKREARRQRFMAEIASLSVGDKWSTSTNEVKRRIGRLETAWREGLQGLMGDIQAMFQNHATIADAYDILDVNIATIKSLCVEKGVFTEAEFTARQQYLFGVVDRERQRRQAELEAKLAQAREEAEGRSGDIVADKDIVDPELVRLRERASETRASDHVPEHATIFGGG